MNASIMQTALGISQQECLDIRCENNEIFLNVQTRADELRCPCCRSRNVVRNGSCVRRFVSVPLGNARTWIEMKVYRLKCNDCGCIRQEEIDFAKGKRRHTQAFARMVIDLSRFATIQDISWFLGVSWDMVCNIQMEHLQKSYGNPDLSSLRYISIDEFAVRKGHVYKTIVLDLETGRIVYAGDGHGKESLHGFWKLLGDRCKNIKAVCTDLSSAYTNAVSEHLPQAALVVDHFHVTKLMNAKIDLLRRQLWHTETDVNKRKVLKGVRWLLLQNGSDIFDQEYKNRLQNALSLNEPLMKAYYLKESLRDIWTQPSKLDAENALEDWVKQAKDSGVQPLVKMAMTVKMHKPFILAWYDYHISNGKIEGVNNKIKVLKRQMYGFRNERLFTLKLYALHDKRLRI